jgi:hypothetical protein
MQDQQLTQLFQADGKILKVWAKIGGPSPAAAVIPTGPRSSRSNNSNNQSNDQYVDGKMGFADPMERDNRGLYSDKMVSNANNSSNGAGRRGGRGGRGRR